MDESIPSTKEWVFNEAWDGNPVIVEKENDNGDYEIINEIVDAGVVNTFIGILKMPNGKRT